LQADAFDLSFTRVLPGASQGWVPPTADWAAGRDHQDSEVAWPGNASLARTNKNRRFEADGILAVTLERSQRESPQRPKGNRWGASRAVK